MHFRLGSILVCLGLTIALVWVEVPNLQSPTAHPEQQNSSESASCERELLVIAPAIDQAADLGRSLAGLDQWLDESRRQPQLALVEVPLVKFTRSESDRRRGEEAMQRQRTASKQPTMNQVQLATFTSNASVPSSGQEPEAEFWPKPELLVAQLESLKEVSTARRWAEEVLSLIEAASQTVVDSPELDRIFSELESHAQEVPQVATAVWNSKRSNAQSDASEVARIGYRLTRRLAVWRAAREITINSFQLGDESGSRSFVAYRRISFSSLDPRWVDYLKLEDMQSAFESISPNRESQKKSARQVLARMYSPVLKPEQAAYVRSVLDPSVLEFLKEQATDTVDVGDLLTLVERYESAPSSFTGYYLNDQYQNLLWSGDPADQAVAAEINTHYRNANFRLAVSERLLNRMIPVLPATAMPVSENVQGARVSGQSHVTNQIRVSLVPDANRWMLNLETDGHVQSDTVARTKSFRILNQGEARFQVLKRLAIGRDGIDSSHRPVSSSSANQFVVDVQSNFDNLPILGWMARKLAVKKLKEKAPETDRLFREKVETSAESLVQQELETQLVKIRQSAYTHLFQPLMAMDLEPEPLQMATTENQVVMRYRLAGRDQMAANTARPRDSGNSLLSFQMHQSSLNNAIAKIGLNGNVFTVDELKAHLRQVLGTEQIGSNDEEDSQRQAEFGFAHFDPIRIDFKDDRLKITLNLRSLQIDDDGKTWKNLSLTVAYKVNVNGMQIQLEQDDLGTRIRGKKLRLGDKAAMSTVMRVVFEQQYQLNALPKGIKEKLGGSPLRVSQLVISNGWLGVSIDDCLPPIQQAESANEQRTGTLRRLMNRR